MKIKHITKDHAIVVEDGCFHKLSKGAGVFYGDNTEVEEFETEEEMLARIYDTGIYTTWQAGQEVDVGDIRLFNNVLYECLQAHTTQDDWQPNIVPALWKVVYEPDEIPEWVQPAGAHDAYNKGDRVWHNGQIWESLIDANVWEPGSTGAENLWTVIEE